MGASSPIRRVVSDRLQSAETGRSAPLPVFDLKRRA